MSFFQSFLNMTGSQADAAVPTPEELQTRLRDGAVLLDVRTPEEYRDERLRDARNLDVMAPSFRERVSRLDRNQGVFVYCRSGSRSKAAAGLMRSMGFADVRDLGGIGALARKGFQIVRG